MTLKKINVDCECKCASKAPSAPLPPLLFSDAAPYSIPSLSPSLCPLFTPNRLFLWQQQNPVQAHERRLSLSLLGSRLQAFLL